MILNHNGSECVHLAGMPELLSVLLADGQNTMQPLAQADGADFEALLEAMSQTDIPATPMGSFPAIFAQPLALGTLSRRRVAHEAQRLLSHLGHPGPRNLQSVARAQSAVWSMQRSQSPSIPGQPSSAPPPSSSRPSPSQPSPTSSRLPSSAGVAPAPSAQPSSHLSPKQSPGQQSSVGSAKSPSSQPQAGAISGSALTGSTDPAQSMEGSGQPERQHASNDRGTTASLQHASASRSGAGDMGSETQQRDRDCQQMAEAVLQEAASAAVAEEAVAAASGSAMFEGKPSEGHLANSGKSGGPGLQFRAALQQLLQRGGGQKLPAEAALATVESADFHWQLANVDRQRWTKNRLRAR